MAEKGPPLAVQLRLSLQRGLWGEVHPQLRQASIEADQNTSTIRIRFEYDGTPTDIVQESCSSAAAEVMGDFSSSWNLDEQHIPVLMTEPLQQLEYLVYLRAERERATG